MIRFAIPASLCIAAMSFAPVAHAAEVQMTATGPVIELSIFESVEIEPDMATISAGVTSEAPTAVEALRANSAEMRRVVDRIKSLGIAERDIQTSGISLNPRGDDVLVSIEDVYGSFGNDTVRGLTRASRAFLEQPPEGFADVALMSYYTEQISNLLVAS